MQDRYDPASSIGWLHHLHNVWPQEAAIHSTYLWIEYLLLELNSLNAVDEKYDVVLEEFALQLESIETAEQRQYVMENLPFEKTSLGD